MILRILALIIASVMLIRPQLFARRAQRRHAERLAALRSGGEERFFEERRSLETYPPPANPRLWQLLGGLLLVIILADGILRE